MDSNIPIQLSRKHCKPCKFSTVLDHPLGFLATNHESIDQSDEIDHDQKKKKLQHENSLESSKLVTTTWNGLDPLSAALSSSKEDSTAADEGSFGKQSNEKHSFLGSDFVRWESYRTKILNKFNTGEKLSIRSTFIFDKGAIMAPSVSQKVKNRLEQLDDFEEGSVNEMSDLSQMEYVKHIDEMNTALKHAWNNDQRVKALKIAIQCAKQLSAINVLHFYPSKFVLITDILDNFGELVHERIEKKTNEYAEDANETCRNWFFKISSIRELLPRFYIECSVLKIYGSLIELENQRDEYERILIRLCKMIRGIGDPLVTIYCRVFLCRVAIKLLPENKKIFLQNVYDIIDNVDQLTCMSVQQCLTLQKVDYPLYYSLFVPALNWIFNCLFYRGSITHYESVLKYFRNKIEFFRSSACSAFVLSCMISSFSPGFIAQNLIQIFDIIKTMYHPKNVVDGKKSTDAIAYPRYILIKNLGDSLVQEEDFFDKYSMDKNLVFREFWNLTEDLKLKPEYIACLETWSELIAKYSTVNDINRFLGDIIANINQTREHENFSPQLLQILTKIVRNGGNRLDCVALFSMNNLLPFLDLFHKEDTKMDACKVILGSFNQNCTMDDQISGGALDPVILNTITYLCKLMHDSINSLSLEDEKRQISTLIIGFIRKVSIKRDLEARLNFYIESRGNFSNLDPVLSFIVHQVNSLSMETHRTVKGHHTKKTISFVNACIAFSYITIPSIYDIILRLQLYLTSAHCALVNGCLPQTDAFLKLTITSLRQLPPYSECSDGKLYTNDEFLYSYSSQLLSTLVVVPDNPELGVLYLFKGLYNVLKEYRFQNNSNFKILTWMNMIRYLITSVSDNYPYHIDRVDSNDTLYAQDEEFIKEVSTYYDIIFQEMLDSFKKSQHEFDTKQQCNVALEFIHFIIQSGYINKMSHVVNQLWNWILKTQSKRNYKSLDHKMKQIRGYLEKNSIISQ